MKIPCTVKAIHNIVRGTSSEDYNVIVGSHSTDVLHNNLTHFMSKSLFTEQLSLLYFYLVCVSDF